MRVFAGQDPQGRWRIYASWLPDDVPTLGIWIDTVDQADLGRRIDELVASESLTRRVKVRRRTKGAGG